MCVGKCWLALTRGRENDLLHIYVRGKGYYRAAATKESFSWRRVGVVKVVAAGIVIINGGLMNIYRVDWNRMDGGMWVCIK